MEDTDYNDLRMLLLRHFRPASPGDAGAQGKTTADLFSLIDQHAPECYTAGMLYVVLRDSGFKDMLMGDEITWCVRPSVKHS